MITHDIEQGTPEWHEFRQKHFNASEAAAMLGISPYMTRDELLKKKVYGIEKEHSEYTQKLFAEGHRLEQMARLEAEKELEMELFPAVGSNGVCAASFDGTSMDGKAIWEHKIINSDLRKIVYGQPETLPDYYMAQVQHQLYVSGAMYCLFTASNEKENKAVYIGPDEGWFERITTGWARFAKDMGTYILEETKPQVTGTAPEQLPALFIELTGKVTASNLQEFRERAMDVIGAINTDLQTDEDFADADKTAKWCKDVEARLDAAKQHALAQTQSIDDLFKTLDAVREEARQKRLSLEKLVKERKDYLKAQIIRDGQDKFRSMIRVHMLDLLMSLNEQCRDSLLRKIEEKFIGEFVAATKGLKTIDSIKSAVDATLSKAFSDAPVLICDYKSMVEWLASSGHAEYENTLLRDLPELLFKYSKDIEAFYLVVQSRISEHQKLIAAQEEKARIAKEQAENVPEVKPEPEKKQEHILIQATSSTRFGNPVDAFLATYGPDSKKRYNVILNNFYNYLKDNGHVK